MLRNVIIAFVLVILAILTYYFLTQNGSVPTTITLNTPTPNPTVSVTEIEVRASNYKFEPNEIRVKADQPVRIRLVNTEGLHDFVVDEFNIATNQIQANQTATVEFTPSDVGRFEYYCSVGNHRQMGMTGVLIVE